MMWALCLIGSECHCGRERDGAQTSCRLHTRTGQCVQSRVAAGETCVKGGWAQPGHWHLLLDVFEWQMGLGEGMEGWSLVGAQHGRAGGVGR